MLILALPAEVIAQSVQALGQKTSGTEQAPQEPTMDNDDPEGIVGDLSAGERYYLDNGLVLELNEDGNTFAVVDFMNVKANFVQIPDSYLGMAVTRIGDLAFKGKTSLEEVVLSDNIQHIGDDVFSGCVNLRCLEENGAKYIGSTSNAHFYLLSAVDQSITACNVSEETKIVASYAFHNCKQLTEIVIPDSVIQVGFRSLRGCDNLQSVTLPFAGAMENGEADTHVGFAFGARTYGGNISFVPTTLTRLVIKRGALQKNALYGLDGVQHLGLPSMQQPLGYYYGGETYEDNIDYIPAALTSVEVVGGELPEKAFYNCVNLENILLGDEVTGIGLASDVFYNTKFYRQSDNWVDDVLYSGNHLLAAKTTISGEYTVRERTLSIGQEAFINCSGLTGITIADSVTDIAQSAFAYCSGLTGVDFGCSVVTVGNYAFRNCTQLTTAILPESVTSIGNGAFMDCKQLTSVAIQNGVSYIGDYVFRNCDAMVEMQIPFVGATPDGTEDTHFGYLFGASDYIYNSTWVPSSLRIVEITGGTFIDDYAFYQCSGLTTIKIPASMERIGSSAFSGCTGITDVYIPNIAAWSRITFENGTANPLYYGATLHADNAVVSELVIPEGTTVIESSAYRYWTGLTSVVIPEGVTKIGSSAFEGCTGLTSVVIPDSVTSIDSSAFKGCSALTSITIGKGVTKIDESAFYNCTALEEIYFNAVAMEDLARYNSVFYNAGVSGDGITVTVGANVTKIPDCLFNPEDRASYAPKIVSVVFEENSECERIGISAFAYCASLTAVTIPESVIQIGNSAFQGCKGLEEIHFNAIAVDDFADSNYVFAEVGQSGDGITVIIGANVTKLPAYLFYPTTFTSDRPNVTEVVFEEGSVCQSIGERTFSGCTGLTGIAIPDSVISIGNLSFYGCTGMKTLSIGKSVISIGNQAFYNCSGITGLVIPDSVTDIGSSAFSGCSGMTTLTIGKGVTSIGTSAYSGCTALTDIHFNATAVSDFSNANSVFYNAGKSAGGITVTIGANVTRIPAYLFYPSTSTTYTPKITGVVFAQGSVCESIGSYAFSNSKLTSIAIPGSVTQIGEGAFYYSSSLTAVQITDLSAWCGIDFADSYSNPLYYAKNLYLNGEPVTQVHFPEGITKIGANVFYNCTSLTSVTIPASVTEIGADAFAGCSGLTAVHIADLAAWCKISFANSAANPISFAKKLYLNGEPVTQVQFPKGMTNVSDYAFYNCGSITAVSIPEGVTQIGESAFYGCSGLATVTTPSSVTAIGTNAFYNCSGLTAVHISDLSAWCQIEFVDYSSNPLYYAKNLYLNGEPVTEVEFPEGTTEIGSNLFYGCSSITTVTIPSSVTAIGASAFYNCTGLTAVHILDLSAWCQIDFRDYYSNPLYYAKNLYLNGDLVTEVHFPEGTTSIDSYVFYNCTSLTTVTMPDSVTSIGGHAFYGCSGITSLEIGKGVTNIGNRAFYGCSKLASITIPDGVSKIGEYTFYGCAALTSLTIPEGVSQIGTSAFSNCTKLRKVTIPASVTSIANNAFYSCSALTGVYISDLAAWCKISFASGGNPLYYAKKLYLNNELVTQVSFPEDSAAVGDYVFYNCTSLTSVTIPESITSIGIYAFYGCSGLTDITIPENVTSIGNYSFYGCSGLTSLTIPDAVTSIGQYAFYNCSKIEKLTIGQGVTTLGTSAFIGCYGLKEIYFNATAMSNSTTNTKAFNYAGRDSGSVTLTIGANVTKIPAYLFYATSSTYAAKITNVVFEEGSACKNIGNYAFGYCNVLASIEIPSAVTSIGGYAFNYCSKLTSIAYAGTYAQWQKVTLGSNWNNQTGAYTIYCSDATVTKAGAVTYHPTAASAQRASSASAPRRAQTASVEAKAYSEGLRYVSNSDGTCYVSGRGSCKDTEVVIPSVSPDGDRVISIGAMAFQRDNTLKSVTIPETIISIELQAFYGCAALERIYFNATAMEDPEEGVYPFYGIGTNGSGITVIIGANVTRIPASLFQNQNSSNYISSVVFEEGSVCQSIGAYAFYYSSLLTSVTLPGSISTIDDYAFFNCRSLTSITIPDSITHIGASAFYGCIGLTEIVIPDGAISIGTNAFFLCENLKKITIPDSVTSLGDAFRGTGYYYDQNNWDAGVLYIGNHLIEVDDSVRGEFVIREGTVSVASNAFNGCKQITSVVIPAGVKMIAVGTFQSCTSLKSVTIPEGVTVIGRNAFNYCSALTSVTIPKSVEVIDELAFYQCSKLSKVTFGDGSMLQEIGSRAFALTAIGNAEGAIEYPADALSWRFIQKATDWDGGLTTWTSSFVFGEEVTVLYEMSDDRKEFYVGEYSGTGENANVPELFSGRPVTQIYEKAFRNAEGLKTVIIPETIQYICQNVFYNCPDLVEIVVNGCNVTMERGMIYGCEALTSLTVPFVGRTVTDAESAYLGYLFGASSYKSAESYVPMSLKTVTVTGSTFIGDHAFEDCKYLTAIDLPDSVKTVGSYAFCGCESLAGEWVLPADLIGIGDYAFASCNGLSDIRLPEGLTEIGKYAFSGCISLREMVIPDSVTNVGVMLLDNCNNIKTVTIGSGLQELPDVSAGNAIFGINKSLSSLTGYVVSEENSKFATDDRGVLYELHDNLIAGQRIKVAVVDAPAKADLKDYDLPEHIVYIAPYAFAYNTSLRWIQLDRVRRIDKCAFMEATSLVAAVFGSETGVDAEATQYAQQYEAYIADKHRPGEVYSQFIGDQAFFGCSMLQYVNLWTDFIVSIGQEAFYDCNKLTAVRLSESVRNIGQNAFGKTALESITVAQGNARYADFDSVLYEKLEDGNYKLLLFPACKTLESGDTVGKVYQTSFRLPEGIDVSIVESYAFRDAQYLKDVSLDPNVEMLVGDYAFQDASVQTVYIGEKITSLGLVRGEGEYTVFESCESLTAIDVAKENPYYSSQGGVLFDKGQTKLIKYPYHKMGGEYSLPDTVSVIASMAFKGNKNLTGIVVSSYVHTVGLEAFYDCSNLVTIYFDHVYAPMSVLENAFTTNTVAGAATQALLCYSGGYYENGSKGEYGWKNYQGIYPLYESNVTPSFEPAENGNLFYAVVVVDSSGVPVDGAVVSLTDSSDKTEVITAADGIAMFYDNQNDSGDYAFSIGFDDAYTVTVTDPTGNYYTYTNPSLMLDGDMLITYITLTRLPTAYGVSCNGQDINSERLELNKSNIDFTDVLLDENGNIRYGSDGQTPLFDEAVEISVIGYCDAGYAFGEDACGLYQNGVKIASVDRTEEKDGATIFYFRPQVADLANEVDIEVRLVAVSNSGDALSCSTVLNIHVFDFFVDSSELNLDDANVNIDLGAAGEFVEMLLGGDGLELSFGEHIKFNTSLEDDIVTFELEGSKELNEKKKTLIDDYKKGFEENNKRGMDTYRFQYTGLFQDVNFKVSKLHYNITFTRETGDSGFYYYRCKVHNGAYGLNATDSNLITTFYGVVNKLDVAGMDTRAAAKLKADLIFAMHYGYVLTEGGDEDTIKAGASKARYSEAVLQLPDKNQMITKQKLEVSVSGEVSFQYIGNGDFRCTGGAIKGSVVYQFNHDQQFVIWVIPVTLRIEAKASGELAITVEVDEQQQVDWEFLLTLELDITASIGAGCSAASVGFYGNIGTVFVLEILPEFGVDSWKIYGEMGAYARVLWFEYKYRFTPDSWADGHYIVEPKENTAETILLSEMTYGASLYLADSYSSADTQTLQNAYHPVVIDGELYKICYADVTGMENYDAYNYVKLALSKWDGEHWSEPMIIDDNGLNDAEYTLYQQDGRLMMTYTQQTQKLTASTANDTYAATENLQIKVVELSGNIGKPVMVAQPDSYAYLTQYALVDGVPTVVWAENADNNMFGVSPDNYIDSTGKSHVFATTANSVWISQCVNGAWTAPRCIESNLSAITQIAINDAGNVAYIVDTNGDLTDTTDRELHYGDLRGDVAVFNDPAVGSVKSVIADGDRFLYYYDAVGEELIDGWMSMSTQENFPQDAPEEFQLIYDASGNVFGIAYSKNKAWQDGDQKKTGSTIYGRFLENGVWGEAVELSAYTPEDDRYVQSFTAVLMGQQILLSASTVNSAGENLLHSTGTCRLGASLKAEIYNVDYAAGQITFSVKNCGTAGTPVYMSIDNGEYVRISEALTSGSELQYAVALPTNVQSVHFALTDNGDGTVSAGRISLAYSDLQTNAKQLLLGANDFLLFSVRNLGNTTNSAITVIRNGAYDAANVVSDAVYKAVITLNLRAGEVTSFTFVNENGEIETAWAVMNLVEPGGIAYHELALSEIAEQPLVSLYTIPMSGLEPTSMTENNYDCLNYGACDGVLQNGEIASANPVLDTNAMEFNPTEDALVIRFFCTEEDSVQQVRIGDVVLATEDYSIVKLSIGGEICIPAAVLADMRGTHTVSVTFASGEVCRLTLKILGHYEVTWSDGDQVLHQENLVEGTVPSFNGEMMKEADNAWVYTFAGWDCTGDGVVDPVTAITENVTYRAVWNAEPRTYTVRWSMLNSAGREVLVTETYLYGDIPNYLGTIFEPEGKQFVGWNVAVEPVTGNAVYTAVYDIAKPVMVGLEIGTLPDKLTYKQGQTVDLTGLVAYKCMNDGSKKSIASNLLRVTADMWSVGTVDVTLSYAGFKAVFQIAVEKLDIKLTAGSGVAAPGETVTIGVNIENNPGIASMRYQVVYDDAVMELIHVEDTGLLGGYQEPAPGIYSPYTLQWTQAGTGEGTMVWLTFLIFDETKCGTYAIDIEPLEAQNGKGMFIDVQGATANVTVPPTIGLQYPTLLLEDEIKMNVYFTLDQNIDLNKMGMLTWTSQPSVVDIATADAVIPGATYNADLGYYGVVTEGIPAQNLGDVVYFCIYVELADGTIAYGKQVQYSPTTYAYNQLSGDADAKTKALYVAILNYGAAAQVFLNDSDPLINANLTAAQKGLVEAFRSDMVHSVAKLDAAKQGALAGNGGFIKLSPTISLDSAFAINYYFTPGAAVAGEMTFYYWNAADFAANSVLTTKNATGSIVMTNENGVYGAAIEGIAAKDIDSALYACGVYTDGAGNTYSTGILPYSLGFYCGNTAKGTGDQADLAATIAVYGYYAASYFAQK